MKSEIFEGEFKYTGKEKEVDGGTSATLKSNEFTYTDVYGKKYTLTDTRIDSYTVVLADDNAKEYLSLGDDKFNNKGELVISKKASSTAIVTPPTCVVKVIITDKGGKQKSASVSVKVTK